MPQKKARIEAVGRNHSAAAPTFLYSWGARRKLNELMTLNTDAAFHQRYNQKLGGGANNGPGLYVSTSLSSSADYCDPADGVLIQIVIPHNIPYISLTDSGTMNELKQGTPKVIAMDINRQNPLIPSILLHTTGDWYCLKTGLVQFREFNGTGSNTAVIQQALTTIKLDHMKKKAHPVLLSQLRQQNAPFANHPWT
jgi:hypothetical protein